MHMLDKLALVAALVMLSTFVGVQSTLADIEVNTCGQAFAGDGFLSADLDCTGFAGGAVEIEGGTLDLRGFTLIGGAGGVGCSKSCIVYSNPPGGKVANATGGGIGGPESVTVLGVIVEGNSTGGFTNGVGSGKGRLRIVDSSIVNNGGCGVVSLDGRVQLVGSTVTGSPIGVCAQHNARVEDSIVSANDDGLLVGGRAVIKNSDVSGNTGTGIHADQAAIIDTQVNNNDGHGLVVTGLSGNGQRLKIVRSTFNAGGAAAIVAGIPTHIADSEISGNAWQGVVADVGPVHIARTSIVSNGFSGVSVGTGFPFCRLGVVDSTVVGNGTDASCGSTQTCADLAACDVPRLMQVACDSSYDVNSGFPGTDWGVCALD
jgi:hypothetical protein